MKKNLFPLGLMAALASACVHQEPNPEQRARMQESIIQLTKEFEAPQNKLSRTWYTRMDTVMVRDQTGLAHTVLVLQQRGSLFALKLD